MKHEINNPLQIMAMNLEMIKTEENKERVDKIKDGANRIAELINNLSNLNDFELVKYASSNRKIITPKKTNNNKQ
jgi:signal transduction histidine kinase